MSNTLLQLDQLSKSFGNLKAVDQLSITLEKGNVYGLLGPNGSGKSTTLGMILNVINPTGGSFSWYQGDLTTHEALKKIGAIIDMESSSGDEENSSKLQKSVQIEKHGLLRKNVKIERAIKETTLISTAGMEELWLKVGRQSFEKTPKEKTAKIGEAKAKYDVNDDEEDDEEKMKI